MNSKKFLLGLLSISTATVLTACNSGSGNNTNSQNLTHLSTNVTTSTSLSLDTWSSIGLANASADNCMYDGELMTFDKKNNLYYACAMWDSDEPEMSWGDVYKWNNNQWTTLGSDYINGVDLFAGITVNNTNGYVYVSGFDIDKNPSTWSWNGSNWNQLEYPGSIPSDSAIVTDTNGDIFIGQSNYVLEWNGQTWSRIGGDIDSDSILGLKFDKQGNLYASGTTTKEKAAVWKLTGSGSSSSWVKIGGDIPHSYLAETLLFDVSCYIYAVVSCDNNQGEVWKNNGTSWIVVGNMEMSALDTINSMAMTSKGVLYASGYHDPDEESGMVTIDRTTYNESAAIAHKDEYTGQVWVWDGNAWTQEPQITNVYTISQVAVDNNDNIYANGAAIDNGEIVTDIWKLSNSNKEMFYTPLKASGKFINPNGGSGGVIAADAICQSVANSYQYPGTYKAIISDGLSRIACTSANCSKGGNSEHKNWVLSANTSYYNGSLSNLIMTTNSTELGNFKGQFPQSPLGYTTAWTGLNSNWTTGETCSGWTTTDTSKQGNIGDPSGPNPLIRDYSVNCQTVAGFYCVQQ